METDELFFEGTISKQSTSSDENQQRNQFISKELFDDVHENDELDMGVLQNDNITESESENVLQNDNITESESENEDLKKNEHQISYLKKFKRKERPKNKQKQEQRKRTDNIRNSIQRRYCKFLFNKLKSHFKHLKPIDKSIRQKCSILLMKKILGKSIRTVFKKKFIDGSLVERENKALNSNNSAPDVEELLNSPYLRLDSHSDAYELYFLPKIDTLFLTKKTNEYAKTDFKKFYKINIK